MSTVPIARPVRDQLDQQPSAQAQQVLKRYSKYSMAAGLIPTPLLDIAAVTAIQLKMISRIAKLYSVPFRKDQTKTIIASFLTASTPPVAIRGVLWLGAPLLKLVPGVGTVAGFVATPVLNGAVTYALGRVFIGHFETGGTFLDLDPDALREYFWQEFQLAHNPLAQNPPPQTTDTVPTGSAVPAVRTQGRPRSRTVTRSRS